MDVHAHPPAIREALATSLDLFQALGNFSGSGLSVALFGTGKAIFPTYLSNKTTPLYLLKEPSSLRSYKTGGGN